MAMRFALASGLVLVFTATATALPTRTKKHRALDARVGGGIDPDEAPDLERAHVPKRKSFHAFKALERARKERVRKHHRRTARTRAHRVHHAEEAVHSGSVDVERRYEGAEHTMIGSEAFDALFKAKRGGSDTSPALSYPDGEIGGEFDREPTDVEQQLDPCMAPKDVKEMFIAAMADVKEKAPTGYGPDAVGITEYGYIVSMAGDFIGHVYPISVGDTGTAGASELDTVKHQAIERMFPIEFGAAETSHGGVVAKYCPDGSTDDQRPAMCETYNKAWNGIVARCGRAFPPRAGWALSLITTHTPSQVQG